MSDAIRRTLGFLMLNWPMLLVVVPIVVWIFKGKPKERA